MVIIGFGFVGEAVYNYLSKSLKVLAFDKYKTSEKLEPQNKMSSAIYNAEFIFLCLPTPYIEGYGFDIGALNDVCKKISESQNKRKKPIVVLKSTVEPGVTERLAKSYNINLVHNPEFLTQRTASKDFEKQAHIVLGIDSEDEAVQHKAVSLFSKMWPDANISVCKSKESEMMKLAANSFYSLKVQYFCDLYLACQKECISFEKVREMMIENGWINPMHTKQPYAGSESSYPKLSFGGSCFPKDISAFSKYLDDLGVSNDMLQSCIQERNKIRKD